MQKVNTNLIKWRKAKKITPIYAKKIKSLFPDKTIHSLIKITTLEGEQSILSEEDYLCRGISQDFWQQKEKNILKGYTLDVVGSDGWDKYLPKPDKEINYTKVLCDEDGFYINGQWGELTEEGYIQKGKSGDYIAQRTDDPSDVWIIKERIFLNSYVVLL